MGPLLVYVYNNIFLRHKMEKNAKISRLKAVREGSYVYEFSIVIVISSGYKKKKANSMVHSNI